MNFPFKIQDKHFNLKPYCTEQEKNILLTSSFEISDMDTVLDILNFKSDYELSDNEKKVLLYKYREISIGDEVDIKFTCDSCGQGNDGFLELGNFVIEAKRNDPDIKNLQKEVNDNNIHEFVDFDPDELDLDEYEALKQRISENQISFNFIKSTKCLKCKAEKKFDLSSPKYIIEIMSEDTLMTLYKSYNYMIFFGNYSKQDIDSMLPFERSIFIGLLNKTKEDLNK